MSGELQPYQAPHVPTEAASGQWASVPAAGGPPPSGAPSPNSILQAVRRRWLLAALVWSCLTAVVVPWIWLVVKPTYTATAYLQREPMRDPDGQVGRSGERDYRYESIERATSSTSSSEPHLRYRAK